MVAPVIIVLDEHLDLAFEITRQDVVFEQDAVLQCLMPTLYLVLGLWMLRCAGHMAHLLRFDMVGQSAKASL